MTQPKALFLDIDGTILKSDHSLSPRVARAVTALKEAGTLVCLATGRSWEALKPLYDQLGLEGPTVCYNGAMLINGPDGEILAKHPLNEKAARAAVELARREGAEMVAYRNADMLYEKRGVELEAYLNRVKIPARQVNWDSLDTFGFTKAIIFGENSALAPFRAELEASQKDGLSAMYSSPRFLELMNGGVDKGEGLKDVCRLRGIDIAASAAMGDGWNDMALLDAAGDAWVMGGAPDELKERFPENRRTLSVEDDGAAIVMEAMLEVRGK